MSTSVQVKGLKKSFGSVRAVDGVDLTVAKGEVLGFLGPNGAGKSTTMRMIAGFLLPDEGSITVAGVDTLDNPISTKAKIGYLPEGAPAYADMTPTDFLRFVGKMRGLEGQQLEVRLLEVIKQTHIEPVMSRPIDTLSKGYKRRVGLAQTLIHDPDILILDEPTDGLDPNQKHEVRDLIRKMAPNKAIIISTHILEEVEAVCSRAVIIADGKVVADGTPQELVSRDENHNSVVVPVQTPSVSEAEALIKGIAGVAMLRSEPDAQGTTYLHVMATNGADISSEVFASVANKSWVCGPVQPQKGRLDVVFRNVTANAME